MHISGATEPINDQGIIEKIFSFLLQKMSIEDAMPILVRGDDVSSGIEDKGHQ